MTDEQMRAAREFARSLASPDFRAFLREQTSTGDDPVAVVATTEECVGDVFDRLSLHQEAFLVVLDEGNKLNIVRFASSHDHVGGECDNVDLNPTTTVGMFLVFLRTHPGTYVCRVIESGHFELIEDGGDVPELV